MKLEKINCPDCNGEIKYIGNGKVYCEKCSAIYELLCEEDEEIRRETKEEMKAPSTSFDIIGFFEYAEKESRKMDLKDFKIGREACKFDISKKALETLKEKCRVPSNETPLMICDSSVFGSGREGFVITENGFYSHEYFETKHYNWESFKDMNVYLDDIGCIAVEDMSFTSSEESRVIASLLHLLQKNLKDAD